MPLVKTLLAGYKGAKGQIDERRLARPVRAQRSDDGAFWHNEIHKSDGTEWAYDEFARYLAELAEPAVSTADRLLDQVRQLKGSDLLDDDFSMIEVRF
ncbi:MAG: hypothetical protein GXY83_33945 [Rhodopirellula sp.]|nr:hypothetical protein [Rhodopirellula sp.]